MKRNTFLWHDYETNGIDTLRDRAVQFAGIRTDEDLNEVDEPIEYFSIPHKDTLPNPGACLVTGITPNRIFKLLKTEEKHKVLNEYDFFRNINRELSAPNTCGVGYNSISYDDEVSRVGFYRNLMNPYLREYSNGCSRWDLINVVRLFAAIYPDEINVPVVDGKPRFKLDMLTVANGIIHEKAHDAVSDVRATIAMAKFIKEKKPDFWNYCFNNKGKKEVKNILDEGKPLLYVSPYFGHEQKYSEIVLPIVQSSNPNEYITIKLTQPLEETKALLEKAPEELKELMYKKMEGSDDKFKRPPTCSFQINKCPVLMSTEKLKEMVNLTPENRDDFYNSFGFDLKNMSENLKWIKENKAALISVLQQVYVKEDFPDKVDPDLAIYSSFFNDKDKYAIENFHRDVSNKDIAKYFSKEKQFNDKRYDILARRIILRNFPELIVEQNLKIKEGWDKHCRSRLTDGYSMNQTDGVEKVVTLTFKEYFKELENSKENEKYDENIINELYVYGNKLASSLKIDLKANEEDEPQAKQTKPRNRVSP